jgi:exopolysaccharide biosynthesis polyprenyl glycosylphosphotransferase
MISFLVSSAYDPKRIYKVVDEFQTVFLSISLGFLLFSGFIFLIGVKFPRTLFFTFVLTDLLVLLGWRLVYRFYVSTRKKERYAKAILIVGASKAGRLIAKAISQQAATDLQVVGYLEDDNQEPENGLPILGKTTQIRDIVQKYKVDEVIFALPIGQYEQVIDLALKVDDIPVRVRVIPSYFNMTYHRTRIENFCGIPLIGLRDPSLNEVQLLFKRIFDALLAVSSLLLAWPIFFIIGLAIKLDSKGSILFKQTRIGENGRTFTMLKFRTMYTKFSDPSGTLKAAAGGKRELEKAANDPRVTRIGRFLRRTSLDELPQLINILRGDMSFVGPRPEMPWRVADYEPWQRVRFSVPQGLTGWWQVNGRANKPMHLHTQDDLYYIENYSIWLDIQILLKTPLVALRGKGAF